MPVKRSFCGPSQYEKVYKYLVVCYDKAQGMHVILSRHTKKQVALNNRPTTADPFQVWVMTQTEFNRLYK